MTSKSDSCPTYYFHGMNEVYMLKCLYALAPLRCHTIWELLSKECISFIHFKFVCVDELVFLTSFN